MSVKKTGKKTHAVRVLVIGLAAIFAVFAAAATGCTQRVPRGNPEIPQGMPAAVVVVAPAQAGA